MVDRGRWHRQEDPLGSPRWPSRISGGKGTPHACFSTVDGVGMETIVSFRGRGRGERYTWKDEPEEGEGAESEQGTGHRVGHERSDAAAPDSVSAGVDPVDPPPPSPDRRLKKDILCTHFGRGLCKYGSACPLAHGGRWLPVGESSHSQ